MAWLIKDLIQPGEYHPPGRAPVKFTQADVDQMIANGRAMLSAGVNVPACWDHQPDAKPQTAAELAAHRAKNTVGNIGGFQYSADGRLEVLLGIDDEADAKQALKTKFVSPGLVRDFKDGTGRIYPGWSVIHAAITPRPVNANQRPFAMLSNAAGAGDQVMLCLSLEHLSMESDDAGDTGGTDESQAVSSESVPEGEEKPAEATAFQTAIEKLASVGLILPGDVTPADAWQHIITAVDTKLAAEGELQTQDNVAEPPDEAKPPEGSGAGGMGMVGMSLEKAQAKLLDFERKDIARRIDRLVKTRRIPAPLHEKLRADAGKVELSFGDDGELVGTGLLARIEAYEALPEGTAFGGNGTQVQHGGKQTAATEVELSHANAVDVPEHLRGKPQTREEISQAVERFLSTAR